MTVILIATAVSFGIPAAALTLWVRLNHQQLTRGELLAGLDAAALAWTVAAIFLFTAML